MLGFRVSRFDQYKRFTLKPSNYREIWFKCARQEVPSLIGTVDNPANIESGQTVKQQSERKLRGPRGYAESGLAPGTSRNLECGLAPGTSRLRRIRISSGDLAELGIRIGSEGLTFRHVITHGPHAFLDVLCENPSPPSIYSRHVPYASLDVLCENPSPHSIYSRHVPHAFLDVLCENPSPHSIYSRHVPYASLDVLCENRVLIPCRAGMYYTHPWMYWVKTLDVLFVRNSTSFPVQYWMILNLLSCQ
ncbi:hypothetical protein RRG08_064147 [Elysia crispata]|uniref:Uncharacterized protein n=1 Tax=Elysia crispata TaxID=231223 RepID=A0AAE0ZM09_9GAST|nr:hypothetical protein RRG08_064147 [Elysia crispata]